MGNLNNSINLKNQIDRIDDTCKRVKPLLEIRCYAYNQKNYIQDCLDGFVKQSTKFPFVALVHDDASNDGTADIIREYAEKYPDIILPIIEDENQYSKKDGSLARVMNEASNAVGAKYIAFCEGDDYWIDPLKLQQQVDFLENNPEYSMCFHEAKIINETSSIFKYPHLENRSYTATEVFKSWSVPTASIVIRKEGIKTPIDKKFINGDIVLILNATVLGKIFGFSKEMSVYRVQNNGLTLSRLSNPITHYRKEIDHYIALYHYFPHISKKEYHRKLSNSYINLGVNELKRINYKGIISIGKGLILSPAVFFQRIKNLMKK